MRKINKRGSWMTEESGKFILGVIAVVLLFMLAFKIAGILTQNTKYEQAKYAMQEIENTINSLKEGETGTVFLESPKDWYLKKFYNEEGYSAIPTTCGGKDCICLCPEPNKNSCERGGVCKVLKENEGSLDSLCEHNKNFIENCFKFELVPLKISFLKQKDLLYIVPAYTDEKVIYTESPAEIPFVYIYKDGKYESADIVLIGDLKTLRLDKTQFTTNIEKQRKFFTDKTEGWWIFKKTRSNIVMADTIERIIGNIKIIVYLEGPREREIYLEENIFIYDKVGKVDNEGNIWLAKDLIESLFDINQDITFYEEFQNVFTTSPTQISRNNKNQIYKTNLWTGIKFD